MNYKTNNTLRTNSNAAERFPLITIKVVAIRGNIVEYRNYHQGDLGKVYKFSATLGIDRETVAMLEPGKSYQITQSVDKFNYTHWTAAAPYVGGKTMKYDAIIKRVAAKKAERKIDEDKILGFMVF